MPPPPTTGPSVPDRQDHLEIREKLALLELIQEVTQTGTWAWDLRSGKVTWSRELESIYGYTGGTFPENYLGFADRVYPEDLARLETERNAAIAAHQPYRTDFRIRLPNGETRWLYSACAAEYAPDGSPVRIIGVNIDITDRKLSEEALLASENRYRGIVEDQTEVIARVRADGTFIHANQAFCRLYGKTLRELLDHPWQPTAHPEDVALVEERISLLSPENPVVPCENRVIASQGEVRWIQFANRGFFDAAGKLVEIQGVGRDITDRKEAEARRDALLEENTRLGRELICLQEVERGALARELHDETSQQLAAIRINAAILRKELQDAASPLLAYLDAIDTSAREIYGVNHRIMEGLHPQILDSAGLVAALRALLVDTTERHPGLHIRLRAAALGRTSPETRIHLFRIVQECLTNVAQHATASRVRIHLGRAPRAARPSLRLVISDNGHGATASATGGHGMIYMRERAHALGGSLAVTSGRGGGLRVMVEIPADD